jgi:hypothetical protein
LRECLRRLGFTGEGVPPAIPPQVVKEVVKRCVGAYQVIALGSSFEKLELASVEEVMS